MTMVANRCYKTFILTVVASFLATTVISCSKSKSSLRSESEEIALTTLEKKKLEEAEAFFDMMSQFLGMEKPVFTFVYTSSGSFQKKSSFKDRFDYTLSNYKDMGQDPILLKHSQFKTIEEFKRFYLNYIDVNRIIIQEMDEELYDVKLYQLSPIEK